MKTPANLGGTASVSGKQLSLLPEPPFCPQWPNPSTLARQVLNRLLTGEHLTQVTYGFDSWRLSAHIKELGYLGWTVERADVHSPNRTRPISLYWLDADIIAKVRAI